MQTKNTSTKLNLLIFLKGFFALSVLLLLFFVQGSFAQRFFARASIKRRNQEPLLDSERQAHLPKKIIKETNNQVNRRQAALAKPLPNTQVPKATCPIPSFFDQPKTYHIMDSSSLVSPPKPPADEVFLRQPANGKIVMWEMLCRECEPFHELISSPAYVGGLPAVITFDPKIVALFKDPSTPPLVSEDFDTRVGLMQMVTHALQTNVIIYQANMTSLTNELLKFIPIRFSCTS